MGFSSKIDYWRPLLTMPHTHSFHSQCSPFQSHQRQEVSKKSLIILHFCPCEIINSGLSTALNSLHKCQQIVWKPHLVCVCRCLGYVFGLSAAQCEHLISSPKHVLGIQRSGNAAHGDAPNVIMRRRKPSNRYHNRKKRCLSHRTRTNKIIFISMRTNRNVLRIKFYYSYLVLVHSIS